MPRLNAWLRAAYDRVRSSIPEFACECTNLLWLAPVLEEIIHTAPVEVPTWIAIILAHSTGRRILHTALELIA